jgi:hypothetical protein
MRELNIKIGTGFILAFDLTNQDSLTSLTDLRETIINIKSKRVFVNLIKCYFYNFN